MRLERNFVACALATAILLASCESKPERGAGRGQNQRNRGPMQVEGFVVQSSAISEDVEVPGTLLPYEETQIRSEVSGRIIQLNIPEGSMVSKGTLLVKLFDQDLQAQLKKLQVQLQIAEKTVERQKELLAINGISQQEYDLSALAVDNLKADIQSTRISISRTEIRAPYDGQIGLKRVSVGAFIAQSDILTTLREVKQLKIEFSVPEKYAKSIVKGYNVLFRVDGGTKDHAARVMATEGHVEQTTRTLKVRALVNEHHPELVPGIFARVNLQLGATSEGLMLPTQAIIPQARNKRVILLRSDSATFRVVETGIRDSSFVQIVRGLDPGDTVITTGLMAIRPGTKVKLTKISRRTKTG